MSHPVHPHLQEFVKTEILPPEVQCQTLIDRFSQQIFEELSQEYDIPYQGVYHSMTHVIEQCAQGEGTKLSETPGYFEQLLSLQSCVSQNSLKPAWAGDAEWHTDVPMKTVDAMCAAFMLDRASK